MNDKELTIEDVLYGIKNVKKEEHWYLTDEARFILLDYINQLQSNWNSLREYYKRKAEETKDSTALYDKWTKYSSVLDKMNELEGDDKE